MKSIRRCEIVTNLRNGEDILFDIDNMKKVLEEKESCIYEYSYIIHDKDVYSKEEETKNPLHKCGELKAPHIHLLLRFKKNQPQKLECVAKWFGIKENFINKVKRRWEDACLYQIHKNAPDKFQYSVDEVTCNFDYQTLFDKADQKDQLQRVIERILSGEIREHNKTLEIDQMLLVTNAKLINEAFKVRSEHLQATVKDRNTECLFITGGSSVGKTTFAKKIARENEMDFFVSSSSNDIMDGYAQEKCIILDDLRPSVLGLADLLKLLDPHTASSVKSRYKNKFLNCELIIITSVLDIDTFYKNVFSEHDEPIMQLKRRCSTYVRMDKDRIYVSQWDPKTLAYTAEVEYINDILDEYLQAPPKTQTDVIEHVHNLIPFIRKAENNEKKDGFTSVDGCENSFTNTTEVKAIPFEQMKLPLNKNKEKEESNV